jgi:hypothetical protein
MVVDDAAQTTCGNTTDTFQFRCTRQKDHFTFRETRIARLGQVAEQGISRRIDMIIDGIFGDGYIFYATGGAAGLGQVDRAAFP